MIALIEKLPKVDPAHKRACEEFGVHGGDESRVAGGYRTGRWRGPPPGERGYLDSCAPHAHAATRGRTLHEIQEKEHEKRQQQPPAVGLVLVARWHCENVSRAH